MRELLLQIWKNKRTIVKSLYNKYFKISKDRDIAMERLEMCRFCLHNSKNKDKPEYNPGKYQGLPYESCTQCGCSIFLKIYSEWDNYPDKQYNPCPKKKWIK